MQSKKHNPEPHDPDIRDMIRTVLMQDWDPIGIKNTAECYDEYDAYIGGVYRLLARGATDEQIVEHLDRIESQQMLWSRPDKKELYPVARKLLALGLQSRLAS